MIKLKPLDKNMDILRPFISKYGGYFNELTLGSRFLWGGFENAEYAIINETLILRETYEEGSFFYFPLGLNVSAALNEIEEFSKEKGLPLNLCCLTPKTIPLIKERYGDIHVTTLRDWADYIYPAEQFKTYAGKKLSGQRNHVNKFNKLYGDYKVNKITAESIPAIKEFLTEFEKENVLDGWAKEEMPKAKELLENLNYLEQFGIYITVNGKIISLSIGEIVGDTLFVHIEKALKGYAGAYPKTAQEFAKAFATDGIKYINREEDCGDLGLRTSKTQYHPCEIRLKPFVSIDTLFDKIPLSISLSTDRLSIEKNDGFKGYMRLCTDQTVNEFWGFNYKDDIIGTVTEKKFADLVKRLRKEKQEYSLVVKSGKTPVGEIVLWDFDYCRSLQIGFRFFPEHQRKGYAFESVSKVLEYVFGNLKAACVRAYCYKENAPSKNLLCKLGFKLTGINERYEFFVKTNE